MGATASTITFKEGKIVHHYPKSGVQTIELGSTMSASTVERPSSSPAGQAARNSVVIPAGTELTVRTNEAIDPKTATEGQKFSAQVDQDVTEASGQVEIPKGSEADQRRAWRANARTGQVTIESVSSRCIAASWGVLTGSDTSGEFKYSRRRKAAAGIKGQ